MVRTKQLTLDALQSSERLPLAYVLKTHGYLGNLLIELEGSDFLITNRSAYQQLVGQVAMIDQIPYQITALVPHHGSRWRLSLKGVCTQAAALQLVQRTLYMERDAVYRLFGITIQQSAPNSSPQHLPVCCLLGMACVSSTTSDRLGLVVEIIQQPNQVSLGVQPAFTKQCAWIPYAANFIQELDLFEKKIYLTKEAIHLSTAQNN